MTYSVSLIVPALLLVIASCKKPAAQVNENYISVNKCQAFNRDGKILTLCLDSVIQDSRCPINTVCVWQGIAVAQFTASSQNTKEVITLATNKFEPYTRDTTLSGFKIEFINLTPHKDMGKPFNYKDYVAEVKITRL